MKHKIITFLLILTSLFGYLEWGTDQHTYLYEIEWQVLGKLFSDPKSVAHPLIFIPLLGQIVLLITLFQKAPDKKLIYAGIGCIGLLLVFMLIVGILSTNVKIIASSLPFVLTSFFLIRHMTRQA